MLCGTTAVREHGQDHHTRHPVLTPEMIRQLPAGYALIVRGGHAPVIARLPMCWKDPLYRAARHAGSATAQILPARATTGTPVAALTRDPRLSPADDREPAELASFPAGPHTGPRYPWDE